MRLLYVLLITALVACVTPTAPDFGSTTQNVGIDKDTGEPWYPDPGDGDGSGGGGGGGQICRNVTISGNVYYNDLRSTGRFSERFDTANNPGAKHAFVAGGTNENYLGLRDAVIDFYEIDDNTTGAGCVQKSYVGGVTIDAHGAYTWTGQVCDACTTDHDGTNDSGVSIAGWIRLKFCNDTRCFSVHDSLGMPTSHDDHYGDTFVADPYRRWLRGASLTAPRVFTSNTPAPLGNDYFQASSTQTAGDPLDLYAQAASVYASLVDTTRVLHLTYGVPYDRDRFGEVQVFYPSVLGDEKGGGAHSHQPENKGTSRICVESQMDNIGTWVDPVDLPGPNDIPGHYEYVYDARHPEAWFTGSVVAHEYGHLVHYWQWDGYGKWTSFCYNDPDCDEGDAPEYVLAALKEGWADFVRRVVFNGFGYGCEDIERRSPQGATSGSLATIGRRWIPDVEQSLCDIWDANANSESSTYDSTTYSDTANTSLVDLVSHLGHVWDVSATYQQEIKGATSFDENEAATSPVGICEFVADRASNSAWVNALKVNGINCNL